MNDRRFGAALMVAGTAIGAGMLTLPISCAIAGFWPSLLTFLVSATMMTVSACYLLEASLWTSKFDSLLDIYKLGMGRRGKYLAAGIYLALMYTLVALYLKACSAAINNTYPQVSNIRSYSLAIILVILFIVFSLGTRTIEWINRIISIVLYSSFAYLIIKASPNIQGINLLNQNWSAIVSLLPLIITCFGFAILIPSLKPYLNYQAKPLLQVIVLGSIVPFIIYSVWLSIGMGIIPLNGPVSLTQLALSQDDGIGVIVAMQALIQNENLVYAARLFTYSAIITSFLGVGLSLTQYMRQLGLSYRSNKLITYFVVFVMSFGPPLLIELFFHGGFHRLLSFTGLFVASLLGLLPAILVYQGRYKANLSSSLTVVGGKTLLILTSLFFSMVMAIEVSNCWPS